MGYSLTDVGTFDDSVSVDYADYGHLAANMILTGDFDRAIICCGTGIGISMAANRHNGIRAAVCHSEETARLAREHNDANIMCMGARVVNLDILASCVQIFLETKFEGGRHNKRIEKINI